MKQRNDVPRACGCLAGDAVRCLSRKYMTSMDFARCMGGCTCRCHSEVTPEQRHHEEWEEAMEREEQD